MRSNGVFTLGVLVGLAGGLAVAGCGNDNTNHAPADMSAVAPPDLQPRVICTPGTQECVTSRTARICAPEGTQWLTFQCDTDETCTSGTCSLDSTIIKCTAADNTCADPSNALICNGNGVGLMVSACPAKTKCVGRGRCMGDCLVGTGTCVGTGKTSICADGFTTKISDCPANTACVIDAAGNPACKPYDCLPDPVGCSSFCGSKVDMMKDPAQYVSVCQVTPDGYRWQVQQCITGQTCDPGGATCGIGSTLKQGACRSDCVPGDQRCALGNSGYQTCDATGKWATTVTLCNPDQKQSPGLVCIQDNTDYRHVLCGDSVCAAAGGACTPDEKFRACDNGKLVDVGKAVACATGVCQTAVARTCSTNSDCLPGFNCANGNCQAAGALAPGSCLSECQDGESRCVPVGPTGDPPLIPPLWLAGPFARPLRSTRSPASGSAAASAFRRGGGVVALPEAGLYGYQKCVGGAWSAYVPCGTPDGAAPAVVCFDYTQANGLNGAVCGGECGPGTHRCGAGSPSTDGGLVAGTLQTCDNTGHWGPATLCSIGQCRTVTSSAGGGYSDQACVADCVPGAKVCIGAAKPLPHRIDGTIAEGTCASNGMRPVAPDCNVNPGACCGPDLSCRGTYSNGVLGCVQCVGSAPNEQGYIDARCTNSAGTFDGSVTAALETCQSTNTFGAPTVCASGTCQDNGTGTSPSCE
jgi:hypothetical protein